MYISPEIFTKVVNRIIGNDISFDPENWTRNNPYYNTCLPVSWLASKYVKTEDGKELVIVKLRSKKRKDNHFLNREKRGSKLYDFTSSQFGVDNNRPKYEKQVNYSSAKALSQGNVRNRCLALESRFLRELKRIENES
ncbi:hypothetical protein K0B04_01275 [Patescibacteria group bacterium]|nr:hypothetical protein [Patescibacteria group bacterium]